MSSKSKRSAQVKQNDKLSEREQQVLKLILEGQSNPEIAATLHLSPNTIKSHVTNILNKLGVNHRLQAAVIAVRDGLIEVDWR